MQDIVEADGETPPAVHEVAHVERDDLRVETLGLHLTEAKDLLQNVQEVAVTEQVRGYLDEQLACPECGQAHRHNDAATPTA